MRENATPRSQSADGSVAYAGAQERSHRALLKELAGLPAGDEGQYGRMSLREKLDFGIVLLAFGVQAGA